MILTLESAVFLTGIVTLTPENSVVVTEGVITTADGVTPTEGVTLQAQTEANGPLVSGLMYYGAFPLRTDRQDCYYIDLFVPNPVELRLANILAEHNNELFLRDVALNDIGYLGRVGTASERILISLLPAGEYYPEVYRRSSGGSSQAFHLSTVYE